MADCNSSIPNLFVIGAAKCGTTSLHFYLSLHPEIEMSAFKEPQIFASPEYRTLLSGYEGLFGSSARVRGESSAVYSQFPRWPGVPERIRSAVPDARLVYLVRDPVDRALAHYSQHVMNGKETRPIEEALGDWSSEESLYLCPSRYATQIQQYLAHFDPTALLIVDQHDLLERRHETMVRIFDFLGVDSAFSAAEFEQQLNTREVHRLPTSVGERLRQTRLFAAAKHAPLPAVARRGLRRLVSRQIPRPSVDPKFRAQLAGALREEMDWFRSFTGQSFASWSV